MRKFLKWAEIIFGGLIGLPVLAGLVLYPISMKKLNQAYQNCGFTSQAASLSLLIQEGVISWQKLIIL